MNLTYYLAHFNKNNKKLSVNKKAYDVKSHHTLLIPALNSYIQYYNLLLISIAFNSWKACFKRVTKASSPLRNQTRGS